MNISILSLNTGDIIGTAKYDESFKSGQVVTFTHEDDNTEFEGKVSFAKKWTAEKYHGVPVVFIK